MADHGGAYHSVPLQPSCLGNKQKYLCLTQTPQKRISFLFFSFLKYYYFGRACREACRILAPQPGIQPEPPAVEAWSLNHGTTREEPVFLNNDWFGTYYVPDTTLTTYVVFYIYHQNSRKYSLLLSTIYRWGNWLKEVKSLAQGDPY